MEETLYLRDQKCYLHPKKKKQNKIFNEYFLWFRYLFAAMDDDNSNPFRRMSSRTRKVAPRMAAALASSDNRTHVCRIRLIRIFFFCCGFCTLHSLQRLVK